jgi:cyclophilin family peptidyl-prolyl cis-trans isomerase
MKKLCLLIVVLFLMGCMGGKEMGNPKAIFETSKGQFTVELFEDKAPKTVQNFVNLTEKGFYDGLTFHRIIKDFMIQGGDPNGDGSGGPGYTIDDEIHPELRHDGPGILSMAKTSAPNTGGSQFFITTVPTPHLDNKHSVFGKVVDGMDIIKNIEGVEVGFGDVPKVPVIMLKVRIEK